MEFLQNLSDGFSWVITVVSGLLTDLVKAYELAKFAAADLQDYLDFLPDEYLYIIAFGLGVAILYMVVGRE